MIATVRYAVPGVRLRRIKDYSSAFTTRNGGGDVVRTDGNLPVLDLASLNTPKARPGAVPRTCSRALSHRLPPPALLAAALLSAANAVIALLAVVVALLQGPAPPLSHRADADGGRGRLRPGAAGIRAHPSLLGAKPAHGRVRHRSGHPARRPRRCRRVRLPLLVNTAITVLVLIALSSNDAARWMRVDGQQHAA